MEKLILVEEFVLSSMSHCHEFQELLGSLDLVRQLCLVSLRFRLMEIYLRFDVLTQRLKTAFIKILQRV